MVKERPIWLGLTRDVAAAGLELLAGVEGEVKSRGSYGAIVKLD